MDLLISTIITVAITTFGGLTVFYFKRLEDPGHRQRFRLELSCEGQLRVYRMLLVQGLWSIRRHFKKRWSMGAYGTCMFWSLVYALVFFLITWLIGGSGKLGNVEFLPENIPNFRKFFYILFTSLLGYCIYRFSMNWSELLLSGAPAGRLCRTVAFTSSYTALFITLGIFSITETLVDSVFIGLSAATIIIVVSLGTWFSVVSRGFVRNLGGPIWIPNIASILITLVFTSATIASAFFVSFYGQVSRGMEAGALMMIAFAAGTVFTVRKSSIAGSISVTAFPVGALVACVGLIVFTFNSNVRNLALTILIFFTILPVINAAVDWISWGVSRYLGMKIINLKNINLMEMISHLIIDIILAIVLLFLLALIIVISFEIVNFLFHFFHGTEVAVDIRKVAEAASIEPWGVDGLWLTLMLLTTIIPTALHLSLSVYGLLTIGHNNLRKYVLNLISDSASHSDLAKASMYFSANYLISIFIVFLTLGVLSSIIAIWRPFSSLVFDSISWYLAIFSRSVI